MSKLIYLILPIFIVSCNPFKKMDDLEFTNSTIERSGKNIEIGFREVSNKILIPHCIRCHSKYRSYKRVFKERNKILKSVLSNSMPKNKPALNINLKNLLQDWIESGAKREVSINNPSSAGKTPSGLSKRMKELFKIHKNHHPVLDKEKDLQLASSGSVYNYQFGETRVGQMQYALSDTQKILTRIDLTENTCQANFKPKACLYVSHFKHYAKKVVWVKHPDKNKIGETVEYSYDEEEPSFMPLTDDKYLTSQVGITLPKLDYEVKDYIICDDWNWLQKKEVQLKSWSVEQMISNEETRVNENRIMGGMYNVKFKKFNDNIYRVGKAEFLEGVFGRSSISFLNGEAGSFIYNQNERDCAVSFKLDLNTVISSVLSQDVSNYIFKPYYKNQDTSFLDNEIESINREIRDAINGVVR